MPRPIITKPEPFCPWCGARMKLRRPKPGGKEFEPFWGCGQFPDCKGTVNIDENGYPMDDSWDEPFDREVYP